ncbi:MAG: hypothetical protein HFI63_00260 [Lachnospiraceae bacterium]|nr:hypothetical protein [Lachnospiraceae bacterium]
MGELKTTKWSRQVTPENVWREYPRPAFARQNWICLNGLWEYAFTREEGPPSQFDGQILVPFSPEAPLSGVGRQLKPEEFLWYRKTVLLPEGALEKGRRILLHFGAVDQTGTVYLNGKKAGSHTGGYLPFSWDITELCRAGEQELVVKVQDISDTGWHSRGKQKLKSGGMFYTAQSGIWQTVWLEVVPKESIKSVRIRPDYENSLVRIRPQGPASLPVTLTVFENFTDDMLAGFLETGEIDGEKRFSLSAKCGREWEIPMEGFKAWSPEYPNLYGLLIETKEDRVLAYFAMRSCSVKQDSFGIPRFFLNNRPYFQTGLLDQGYWPDGLYTAPCDEALVFDIKAAKSMGFNLLRKHVKVEMARWYYHCDRLGMLVWQDMVNGGSAYHSWFVTYLATAATCLHIPVKDTHRRLLSRREKEGREQFYREMRETVRALYNFPSIVAWVPFNEGWGQFETKQVTERLRSLDPSRLIDAASGWFDQGEGDVLSIHSYFFSYSLKRDSAPRKGENGERMRAAALTEYGGYCLPVEGHQDSQKIYGYRQFRARDVFFKALEALWEKGVRPRIKEGLSAAIYTQLSDVEEEINGLLTYDREVQKVLTEDIKGLNERLLDSLKESLPAKSDCVECKGPEEPLSENKRGFTKQEKREGATATVIGGADGPTSVFLAGKRKNVSKSNRQMKWKQKMERQSEKLLPNAHTTEELKAYLIETYGARPIPEATEEYQFLYRAMKSNLVIQENPELLKTPEPKLPDDMEKLPEGRLERLFRKGRLAKRVKPSAPQALSAYMEAFECRMREAEKLPDDVFPMSYNVYRFPVLKEGKKMGEIRVELEDIRQKIGMSYSSFQSQEESVEISKDIIRYFGVRGEDIETKSDRLVMYLHFLGKI